ncbi:hypothetical protein ACFWPH_28685 [Nocardia sp. NPDC058499]|uniref:hypothetical protein n=1 Tax=Nocardia sp. NPDC058499 TaxID=3346530 RepID=UPI00366A0A04
MNQPDLTAPPAVPAQTLADIHRQVVELLDRAARLRRPARPGVPAGTAPTPAPGTTDATEPIDFAGFLVPILAEVAANCGGVDALLAGRPGSWEAAGIERLLDSAGCEDPDVLAGYRSAPIVIDVRIDYLLREVGQLVDDPDTPGHMRWQQLLADGEYYEDQLDALELARSDALEALTARSADLDYSQQEHALEQQFDADADALRRRWTARYTRYLDAFRATATNRAAELGLTVPVEVRGNTDPDAHPTSPGDLWDADPLAAQIYEHAVRATPTSLLTTDAAQENL